MAAIKQLILSHKIYNIQNDYDWTLSDISSAKHILD